VLTDKSKYVIIYKTILKFYFCIWNLNIPLGYETHQTELSISKTVFLILNTFKTGTAKLECREEGFCR
jgi:hypothetical protein